MRCPCQFVQFVFDVPGQWTNPHATRGSINSLSTHLAATVQAPSLAVKFVLQHRISLESESHLQKHFELYSHRERKMSSPFLPEITTMCAQTGSLLSTGTLSQKRKRWNQTPWEVQLHGCPAFAECQLMPSKKMTWTTDLWSPNTHEMPMKCPWNAQDGFSSLLGKAMHSTCACNKKSADLSQSKVLRVAATVLKEPLGPSWNLTELLAATWGQHKMATAWDVGNGAGSSISMSLYTDQKKVGS